MYSLDTLSAARDLEAVGFNPQQAEAIVAAISRADEQLATKNDVAQLATKGDFEEVRLQIAQLATKDELGELRAQIALLATKEEIAQLATKDELESKIAQLATKDELESKIAHLATKAELEEVKRHVAVIDAKVDSLRSEFRWVFGFLAPFILAMAARMFGII